MRRVTVRFGDSLWNLIEDESNRDGVSAAQWIRDATLARALWERRRRDVPDGLDVLRIVREEHRAEDLQLQKAVQDVLRRARPELDAVLKKVPPDTAAWIRELYGL
jgi:hypothetical protein